ncbi:MAG: hypothetical protein ACHQQS_00960 [Thermoanaerobaculales bacterium]
MAKLDANLDACRLSNDILQRLRKVVREELQGAYGSEWEKSGITAELYEFLTQRKTRETNINWNLSDACDLLDYAGFANIYEIIAAAPRLLERFLPLAPDASVLRIRFLELDTILNRVGYARPVSDADLGFLASFDERVKRTLAAAVRAEGTAAPPGSAKREAPHSAPGHAAPMSPEVAGKPSAEASAQAPHTTVSPPSSGTPPEAKPDGKTVAAPPRPVPPAAEVTAQDLEAALRRGDHKPVLTALYQEVTGLADGLWNGSTASVQPRTWERVRESAWYNDNFAKLGLRPISDFFSLFDAAEERTRAGASRNDLQEFLKEHNFVQVLLALKELFRQHIKA